MKIARNSEIIRWLIYLKKLQVGLKWTVDENLKLLDLHEEFGNKWKLISLKFSEKNETCVKKQLYSLLRKALGQLGKLVSWENRDFQISKIKPRVLKVFLNTILPEENSFENNFLEKFGNVRELVKQAILEDRDVKVEEWQKEAVLAAFDKLPKNIKGVKNLLKSNKKKEVLNFPVKINEVNGISKELEKSLEVSGCSEKINPETTKKSLVFNGLQSETAQEFLRKYTKVILKNRNRQYCQENQTKEMVSDLFLEQVSVSQKMLDCLKNINEGDFKELLEANRLIFKNLTNKIIFGEMCLENDDQSKNNEIKQTLTENSFTSNENLKEVNKNKNFLMMNKVNEAEKVNEGNLKKGTYNIQVLKNARDFFEYQSNNFKESRIAKEKGKPVISCNEKH